MAPPPARRRFEAIRRALLIITKPDDKSGLADSHLAPLAPREGEGLEVRGRAM